VIDEQERDQWSRLYKQMMRYACAILLLMFGACAAESQRVEDDSGWSLFGGDEPTFAVPPGNVKVEIERHAFGRFDRTVFDAAADYRDDAVHVHAGGPGTRNGLTIFAARDDVGARLSASHRSGTYRSRSRGFAMVVPGATAQLDVVEVSPQPYIVVIPTYDGGALVGAGTEQIVTGSSMRVTVLEVSEQGVTLELLPYFHGEQRRGRLMVEQLATTVTVPEGRPIVIMADRQQQQSLASQWLSRTSQSQQTQVIAVLTVDVGR
jgi:hypothetical protein